MCQLVFHVKLLQRLPRFCSICGYNKIGGTKQALEGGILMLKLVEVTYQGKI
jgi:hypothetical protein